jgi:hypothetical protein
MRIGVKTKSENFVQNVCHAATNATIVSTFVTLLIPDFDIYMS